ncbi:MAG: hypothetical protein WBM13_08100 [Bacteroidia bacterium]
MKNKIILLALVATSFFACNNAKNNVSEDSIKYYYGEVITTSPDGTIPYGPPRNSLVKRTIFADLKRINELVTQDGQVFDTQLTQLENLNQFSAKDSLGTFEGSVTFADEKRNTWTYDITLKTATGKLVGNGNIDNEGIKTEKYFLDSAGVKTVKIVENLREINEDEYKKLKNK